MGFCFQAKQRMEQHGKIILDFWRCEPCIIYHFLYEPACIQGAYAKNIITMEYKLDTAYKPQNMVIKGVSITVHTRLGKRS